MRLSESENESRAFGDIGKSVGNFSWKSVSAARIATTGADSALARLPSANSGSNRAFASGVRTKSTRNGWLFMAVGAWRVSS